MYQWRLRRSIGSFVAVAMVSSFLGGTVAAQSQNEVVTTVLYDGTPSFTDGGQTTSTGIAPEPHVAGTDDGANNLVVRTHDQFALRVDWNVNEADASDVTLTVELPPYAQFTTDDTLGYAGCEVTDFSADPLADDGTVDGVGSQTVVCELGDQAQGSFGAVRMTALLNETFDNTTFDVRSTLRSADDPQGVEDGLDQLLTVSEQPSVDYIKETPVRSDLIDFGTADPDDDGYVVLYPLTIRDYSQGTTRTGIGPIDDQTEIVFYDHAWGLTDSARLATADEMTAAGFAGDPCGNYSQSGSFVVGNGLWSCDDLSGTSAGTYPVVEIRVEDFVSRDNGSNGAGVFSLDGTAPALLADGSNNFAVGPQISSGQIAFWLDADEVTDEIEDDTNGLSTAAAVFDNSIALQDETFVVDPNVEITDQIVEAAGHGTSISNNLGVVTNNTSRLSFGAVPTVPGSGGGSWRTGHDIRWLPGPLQLAENQRYGPEQSYVGYDIDTNGVLPGQNSTFIGRHFTIVNGVPDLDNSVGAVSRGQTVTLEATAWVFNVPNPNTNFIALHQCIALDNSHYNLTNLPSAITVRQHQESPTATGYSTVTPSDGIAHVQTGQMLSMRRWNQAGLGAEYQYATGGTSEPWPYVVEVAALPVVTGLDGTNTARVGFNEDQLTCDETDENGDTIDWVATTAPDFDDIFDDDGDGLYSDITRVRVRSLEAPDAQQSQDSSTNQPAFGWHVFLQAQVLQDLTNQRNGQELFAFTSHSFTEGIGWDGTGTPPVITTDANGLTDVLNCVPYILGDWDVSDPNDSSRYSPSGWCSNEFLDDGSGSFDTTDSPTGNSVPGGAYDIDTTGRRIGGNVTNTSGTVIETAGARLLVSKVNNDGLVDIADNGDLVTFTITPRVVGAATEAVWNARLIDELPDEYVFESMTQPGTPGSSCVYVAASHEIQCQFSTPNPGQASGDLPFGLAGGWPAYTGESASFQVTVRVEGAVANADFPTVLTNEVSAISDGLGPWDPNAENWDGPRENFPQTSRSTASSFMPLPNDEGAILKVVDALEGACDLHPSVDPPPAGWGDRCSKIDFNGNMSFLLSLENDGNTTFSNVGIVDVFPYTLDDDGNNDGQSEPDSATDANDTEGDVDSLEDADDIPDSSDPNTTGDARTPGSDFDGSLSFVGVAPVTNAANAVTWVSGDTPSGISRDPLVSVTREDTRWCTDSLDNGGTVVVPVADAGLTTGCPETRADVTASYTNVPGPLAPGDTLEVRLTLDTDDVNCDNIWTNTFGARVDELYLPIRSNDVSVMVNCEFDLALQKTLDPSFVAGGDWLTPGTTVIPFLIEVTNQGDPVNDFDVTDYVDTNVFSFDAGQNPSGTTQGDASLNFAWDLSGTNPVVSVDGVLPPGDSVVIPVNLTVASLGGALENWAEISYFDSDGDPSNGDSDPGNAANPSTGALIDEDSTPDQTQANDVQPAAFGDPSDDVISGDGSGLDSGGAADLVDGDEDDHDVAGISFVDLELIKTLSSFDLEDASVAFDITVTNQGTAEVYLIDVVEYPPTGLSIDVDETRDGLPGGVTFDGTDLFTVEGPLAPDASVVFPVTFTIDDIEEAPFTNAAEIAAFDDNNTNGDPLSPFTVDVDSTPDRVNGDAVIDQVAPNYDPDADANLNEPTPGDEDDHDIAVFTPPVRIGDFVWIDADGDGVQDVGESPVPGVTVNLLDADGDPVLDVNDVAVTTTTDSSGEYFFEVAPGEYIVEFDVSTLPAGTQLTTPNDGGDDAVDSDADPITGRTGVIDVSDLSVLSDTDTDGFVDDYTWDAGVVPVARIGDYVWMDADRDGIQDVDESPVPGVTVNLLDADGEPVLDASGVVMTAVTNGDGEYFFDVPDGQYIIEFDPATIPAGTQFTRQGEGDSATGSDVEVLTGRTSVIAVDTSLMTDSDADGIVDDYTHDAGLVIGVEIGNYVWFDADGDGVQDDSEDGIGGVIVELLDASGEPVLDEGGVPIATTTASDGSYLIVVSPGDYQLRFTPPEGLVPTNGTAATDDLTDSDADQFGLIDTFTVESGVNDYSFDTGFIPAQLISGLVWFDDDQDGVQDPGEEIRSEVVVELLDETGEPVLDENGEPRLALTDPDGEFEFEVPPGNYRLRFVAPDGTVLTPGNGEDHDGNDGITNVISVPFGVSVPGIDAGLVDDPDELAITGRDFDWLIRLSGLMIVLGFAGVGLGARVRRSWMG